MTPDQIEHARLMEAYEKAPHGFKLTRLRALQRHTNLMLRREIAARRKARQAEMVLKQGRAA